jgi:hypothetical protein
MHVSMAQCHQYFGNWLHGIDLRFGTLIRVGAIAIIWSLWLCKMIKVLITKIVPS